MFDADRGYIRHDRQQVEVVLRKRPKNDAVIDIDNADHMLAGLQWRGHHAANARKNDALLLAQRIVAHGVTNQHRLFFAQHLVAHQRTDSEAIALTRAHLQIAFFQRQDHAAFGFHRRKGKLQDRFKQLL